MRLVLNGIPLLSSHTGVGNYVYHLATSLQKVSSEIQATYFYGNNFANEIKERGTTSHGLIQSASKRSSLIYDAMQLIKSTAFKVRLPSKSDLYHETNFIPMPFNGPTVVTVFDLSLHLFPNTHPAYRRRYFERTFYKRLPWAEHFITISQATKNQMVELLNISPEKISVTPLGINPKMKKQPRVDAQIFLSQYGLIFGAYILFVGTLEPRKNIETLLQAYAALPKRLRSQHPLVLAGRKGWRMDHLDSEIRRLGIESTTHLIGYVPLDHLPALYSGATVFVYPSLYEGFGLPPLEAMACGSPVITSNCSSLPEVVGDAGVQVEPRDTNKLREEIEWMLEDTSHRNLFCQRGLERAELFTWKACVEGTVSVYSEVLKRS